LRVKEFLWELVLVVSAPSELAGSFIMEILHSVEDGDVNQVCSNLETILSCLRMLISLSHSLVFYILHAYIVFIYICLIYLVFYCHMLEIICSHLYSTKRL